MIHYHGTPITPNSVLTGLAGRSFSVSFARPDQVILCHQLGQSVMLDNGAFSLWRRNPGVETWCWDAYYDWARDWLEFWTTWAVIPDLIGGSEEENDRLIAKWFAIMGSYRQAAPVWHLHESLDRLDRLVANFDRVCLGSSAEFAEVGKPKWSARMSEAMEIACRGSGRPRAWLHMLRGLGLVQAGDCPYPFSSADSTNIGRNHNRGGDERHAYARRLADEIDSKQTPARWNAS